MTYNTASIGDTLRAPQAHEIAPDVLELVLQPSEVLAAQFLDGSISVAEADPQTDPEALELLRFQRYLVDLSPDDADGAARNFAVQTGKYATVCRNFGDGRLTQLHYPVNRDFIVMDCANAERWKIAGIDPAQYGDDAYGNAYRREIEQSWYDAMNTRETLQAAQAAEAKAMERASHPPVYEPRVPA